ncbi:hypothetical protein I6A84_33295 [Frankia sp. CNm7]|uniref:Glycerophosphoryl diester phosphodiesterase membrane domain-containing protein n=1 Tax=Frankia nepalensis TaxID=1836974 RepID=A0A937RNE9_9ACTN|nr:hypothetical protein [Frankia nepalensis]MBL7496867.1 hypothetical protein [Frankia nepalensis]MBL7512067.1 hypothetical protein [Frankia nepalensis]MBL7522832.1 hypothetical protein [Frankia nepalensis]MBL7630474.1 hypothetical protein [Frankia nepalensis]
MRDDAIENSWRRGASRPDAFLYGKPLPLYPGHQYVGYPGPEGHLPPGPPQRSRTVRELFAGTFATIRRYPAATLGVAAVGAVIVESCYLVMYFATRNLSEDTVGWFEAAFFALDLTLISLLSAVIALVAAEEGVSAKADAAAALRRAARLLPGLFAISLVVALAVVGGAVTLGVVSAWLGVLLCLAAPCHAVEGGSVGAALRRSGELVRRRWWRTFGVTLVASLPVFAGTLLVYLVVEPALPTSDGEKTIVGHALPALLSLLLDVAIYPVLSGVFALLYLDRRTHSPDRWPTSGATLGTGEGWPPGPAAAPGGGPAGTAGWSSGGQPSGPADRNPRW